MAKHKSYLGGHSTVRVHPVGVATPQHYDPPIVDEEGIEAGRRAARFTLKRWQEARLLEAALQRYERIAELKFQVIGTATETKLRSWLAAMEQVEAELPLSRKAHYLNLKSKMERRLSELTSTAEQQDVPPDQAAQPVKRQILLGPRPERPEAEPMSVLLSRLVNKYS